MPRPKRLLETSELAPNDGAYNRTIQPHASALALNINAAEPAVTQEPSSLQCEPAEFDLPQSEPRPPTSMAPGIGHNRGPPQLEQGDTLNGVKEIHEYLCKLLGRKQSLATTYWQINQKLVPARKFGRFYIASKRGIAQRLATGLGFVA